MIAGRRLLSVSILLAALASTPGPAAASEDLAGTAVEAGTYTAAVDSEPERNWEAVAALLGLWLVARVADRRSGGTHVRLGRPGRDVVSPQELAQAAFSAARSSDFDAYRALYLTGAEASRIMGRERAEAYIDERDSESLRESFAVLCDAAGPGAVFAGVAEGEEPGDFAVVEHQPDGMTHVVPLGRLARLGGLWRIERPPIRVLDLPPGRIVAID